MNDPFLGCLPDAVQLAPFPFSLKEYQVSHCSLSESNTSFVARLCWYYRIKPLSFLTTELESETSIQRITLFSEVGFRYNGYGKTTTAFLESLKNLTGNDVRLGSYSHFGALLDPAGHGFIAKSKKWCPLCYKERFEISEKRGKLERDKYVYLVNGRRYREREIAPCVWDDLYWSLTFSCMCVKHRCALVSRCRECHSFQPYISNEVAPGYCDNCFARLDNAIAPHFSEEESELQIDFLQPFLMKQPDPINYSLTQLLSNFDDLHLAEPAFDHELLAEIAGLDRGVIKSWISQKCMPSIQSIFAIQKGLMLKNILPLIGAFGDFFLQSTSSPNLSIRLNHRNSQKNKMVVIMEYLQDILDGNRPYESREKVAKHFDVSVGFLYHTFDRLLRQIADKRRQEFSTRKLSQSHVEKLVKSAIVRCVNRHRKVTVSEIIGLIPKEELRGISPALLSNAIASQMQVLRDETSAIEQPTAN